jgi:primosomal protein N' (replication factor Y)
VSVPRLIEVALPLPLFRTFTYAVESEPANPLVPGTRVIVPLRTGKEVGIYLGPSRGEGMKVKAKPIIDVPDAMPAIPPSLLDVCRWLAEYYVVPLGVATRSALPVLLTGAAAPRPAQRTRRVVVQHQELPSLLHRDRVFARTKQQRALFELLESMGGRSAVDHLLERLAFSPSVLKGLVARGLVTVEEEIVSRDPFLTRAVSNARHSPTTQQQAAIDAMVAGTPGETFLLHGVTGSGKTLVYLELLRHVVDVQDRTAIVLVPEIALTPQTVDRFRSVFGDRIAVLHSALSDGERYDAWLALRRGEKRIAVGARSALFAPLENVGAIIVDEEHEASYKQGENPRYHARETAIVRARAEGAVVVLGSATPSLESWENAQSGKYRLLTLAERVGGGRLPKVTVVDLRGVKAAEREAQRDGRPEARGAPPQHHDGPSSAGAPHRPDANGTEGTHAGARAAAGAFRMVVSPPLEHALADRLERREQSILLLNRRGYSAFVQCHDCGDVATCPDCSITLTYHRSPERLVCHYCQHQEQVQTKCKRCGGTTLRHRGLGTQQVERLLIDRFPNARIARMDVDTTSGKWAHTEILDRVGSGEVDILLGTQMIAKGLDFANVTLVGVIDADTGINLPDFRASERCFQLLAQVAGRAGRGPKGGEVFVQTRVPTHHAVRHAVTHAYEAFATEELAARKEPSYPPNLRLANIVMSGTNEDAVAKLATEGADWMRRLIRTRDIRGLTLIGPAPCPVERIKTRWRWHFLLKAEHPGDLTRAGRYFMERFPVPGTAQLRVTFDRDPVALL